MSGNFFEQVSGTYREDPLWVALGPHVGVMNLFQDHPGFVVFPVLVLKETFYFTCPVQCVYINVRLFLE